MGFVYFGPEHSLKKNQPFEQFNWVSKFDRYRFAPDYIPFYIASDPQCAKDFGFDPNLKTLALFPDKDRKPLVKTEEKGNMEGSDIIKFLLNGMSKM